MALLLAPGFMTDADLWRDVESELEAFGPFIHADLSRDTSFEAMAQRALERTPQSFIMVGFSMGGYVAREIVRLAPGRVTSLILIATSSRGDTAEQERRKARHATQVAGQAFAGLSRSAIASSLHPDRAGDTAMIERIQAMALRLGSEVFQRQCMLARHGDRDRLNEISCPTLILAGDQDRLRTLDEAKELQAGIAASELTVIQGTGHMLPIEAPHRVAGAVATWINGS